VPDWHEDSRLPVSVQKAVGALRLRGAIILLRVTVITVSNLDEARKLSLGANPSAGLEMLVQMANIELLTAMLDKWCHNCPEKSQPLND
jgi:hypothetical protein